MLLSNTGHLQSVYANAKWNLVLDWPAQSPDPNPIVQLWDGVELVEVSGLFQCPNSLMLVSLNGSKSCSNVLNTSAVIPAGGTNTIKIIPILFRHTYEV